MTAPTNTPRLQQIRAVAERLFRDKGYLAASMREIAREVDMKGGGSLYAHIRGKEDLLWDIVNDATDAFFAALTPTLASSDAPATKLRRAMIGHILTITTHLGAAAAYFDEWRHLAEPRGSQFLARRDDYERLFGEIVAAGMAAGDLRPADPRLTTLHILSSLNAVRVWYKPEGRLSAQAVADSLADLLMHGLCC
jgi:AcrR family transcriptional regulator